mmetsp:Transcript_24009/g.38617  ORF Transcript_24009/g.38617 Transcript_24009/m.38617 type:complete len:200 (-) Transcript_24009:1842-2441(-)
MSALSFVYPSPRSARTRSSAISAFLNTLKTASNPSAPPCATTIEYTANLRSAGNDCQPPVLYIRSIASFATSECPLRPRAPMTRGRSMGNSAFSPAFGVHPRTSITLLITFSSSFCICAYSVSSLAQVPMTSPREPAKSDQTVKSCSLEYLTAIPSALSVANCPAFASAKQSDCTPSRSTGASCMLSIASPSCASSSSE